MCGVNRFPGTWWRAEAPETTVPGFLLRESDRWVLSVIGTLSLPNGRHGDEVLHGTHGEEPVTLLNCARLSSHGTGGGVLEETWLVRTAVVGASFSGWDEPAFDLADAGLDDLAAFMDLRLVDTALHADNADADESVVIRRPPRLAARVPGAEYDLFSGGTTTTGARDYRYRYRASLHVALDESVSLSDMHYRHLRPLALLLSVATGEDTVVRDLRLGRADRNDPMSRTPRWQVLDPRHEAPPDRRDTVAPNMLFTCSDWDFAAGFPTWLAVVESQGPTCDLLASRNEPGTRYLSTLFLNTVTAAESFHRRWTPGRGKATAEHRKRVNALVAAVAEHERAWLRDRLAYSHEPSLSTRLQELVAYAGRAAEPYVGKPSAWAQKVAEARNALVHRPPRREDPEAADPHGLMALERSVAGVTTACLLRELGFSPDEAARRMNRGFGWNGAAAGMRARHPNLFEAI